MLDRRSPLIWAAPPAGLLLGALAWATAGPLVSPVRTLNALEARLAAVRPAPTRRPVTATDPVAEAVAAPIFGAATGPEPSVQLVGVVRTTRRVAALVSINGGAPQWLERGTTVDGLTLQEVQATSIIIDSVSGPRAVGLWDKPPAPSATGTNATRPPLGG